MITSFITPGLAPLRRPTTSRVSRPHHRTFGSAQCSRIRAKAITPSNEALSTPAHRYEGISWSQVENMCKYISEAIKPEGFDVILAVTRGGLVPATLLCEAAELRTILSTTVIFYTDAGEQFFGMTEPRFLSFPSADALEGRRVLIVDDVWDSGRTAHAVKIRVGRANPKLVKVAVLHYKREMNVYPGEEPDFYAATTSSWVVYPWERASPVAPQVDPGVQTSSHHPTDAESATSAGN